MNNRRVNNHRMNTHGINTYKPNHIMTIYTAAVWPMGHTALSITDLSVEIDTIYPKPRNHYPKSRISIVLIGFVFKFWKTQTWNNTENACGIRGLITGRMDFILLRLAFRIVCRFLAR